MEILEVLSCVIDPEKIRVIAKIDGKFPDVMPYLARLIPNASYNEKKGWITFKRGQSVITIHNDGMVGMAQVKDRSEAEQILKDIESKAREAWEKRVEIDAGMSDKRSSIGPFDVYTYLPKTNCGECGEATCMAFAVKLLNGEKKIDECLPLVRERRYATLKDKLLRCLISAGFNVVHR